MSTTTSPDSGRIVWSEFVTDTPGQAAAFLRDLFNWDLEERYFSDSGTYRILKTGGVPVCGVEYKPDLPGSPYWTNYVQVADIAAQVAKAEALGAEVRTRPTAIPGVGTYAIIRLPRGGEIAMLEPLAER